MASELVAQQRSAEGRKTVTRGVSYPFINLGEALEAARKFYQAERKTSAPVRSAIAHFGYAETSSGGRQTVSALLQFGLLEDEGRNEDRHVKLTSRALTALLSEEDSPERRDALAECVMSPKIYRDIFSKWPDDLPSDQTISFFLQRDKNFNLKAIASFIKDLRASLSLVGIDHPRELLSGAEAIRSSVAGRDGYSSNEAATQIREDVTVRHPSPLPHQLAEYVTPTPGLQLAVGEKEWMRGSLSKNTEYRLLITGTIGSKQIARLIKLLEVQKSVLEDDDEDDEL